VAPDNTFEVIGSEMVTIVNTDNISYSNYNSIQDGDPIIINDIRVGFLQCGCRFDLNTWKIISSQGIPISHNTLLKNAGIFN
jgi:cyanophycinase-like exopeptidase